MHLRWLGTSCFEIIADDGARILTDPFLDECPWSHSFSWQEIKHVDYILISHTHYDHIANLNNFFERDRPKILIGKLGGLRLLHDLDLSGQLLYGMEDGEELSFSDVLVKRIAGRHTIPRRENRHLVRESAFLRDFRQNLSWSAEYDASNVEGYYEFSNFLITLPDNTSLLFWGGSVTKDQTLHAQNLFPNIVLMQVPSNDPAAVSTFIKTVGASCVIPHHQDVYADTHKCNSVIDEMEKALIESCPWAQFIPLNIGHWYKGNLGLTPCGN